MTDRHEYTPDIVREAFPYVFTDYTMAGVSRREPGMPGGGGGDPRNATTMSAVVADVRWAWKTCEWITENQAKILTMATLPLSHAESAYVLDMREGTFAEHLSIGYRELANWLNATPEQRAARYIAP